MEHRSLVALGRLINELRVIEPEFPASYAAVLVAVAKHIDRNGEEPIVAEVADAVGVHKPSMSRIILSLSERRLGRARVGDDDAVGRKGLGLLTRSPDTKDLRMIRVGLSEKGKALLQRMAEHMDT